MNKRRRHVQNIIASKGNTTKVTTNKVNKKSNKSIFDLRNKDIMKDLLELKNTVKNNKIKKIKKDLLKSKNTTKNNKNKDNSSEVKAKTY